MGQPHEDRGLAHQLINPFLFQWDDPWSSWLCRKNDRQSWPGLFGFRPRDGTANPANPAGCRVSWKMSTKNARISKNIPWLWKPPYCLNIQTSHLSCWSPTESQQYLVVFYSAKFWFSQFLVQVSCPQVFLILQNLASSTHGASTKLCHHQRNVVKRLPGSKWLKNWRLIAGKIMVLSKKIPYGAFHKWGAPKWLVYFMEKPI